MRSRKSYGRKSFKKSSRNYGRKKGRGRGKTIRTYRMSRGGIKL